MQHYIIKNEFEEMEESVSDPIHGDIRQPPPEYRYRDVRVNNEFRKSPPKGSGSKSPQHKTFDDSNYSESNLKFFFKRCVTMFVPADMVKFIMGKQGHTIKSIQMSSGAYCYVAQDWDTRQPQSKYLQTSTARIIIKGNADAIR
jgi:hypothetical protein